MVVGGGLLAGMGMSQAGAAEAYPGRPIRLIVPAGAGGNVDLVSRVFGQYLGAELGQPIVVEDRPGGSGNIGMAYVAHASPDGYTLAMTAAAMVTINPFLYQTMGVRHRQGHHPHLERRHRRGKFWWYAPHSGVTSMSGLIALAKAKPGELHASSAGVGSLTHLALEMLKVKAKVDIVHVPYRSAAEAMNGLLGGAVEMMVNNISAVQAYLKDGRVLALATTGTKRDPRPAGRTHVPGGGHTRTTRPRPGWAVVGPAGLPDSVVERLSTAIRTVLAQPEVREARRGAGERAGWQLAGSIQGADRGGAGALG